MEFTTDYNKIIEQIDAIDPIAYGRSRNFKNGAITYLSPYISRGVINTKFVLDRVLQKNYKPADIETFIKELAWRDYFQLKGQTHLSEFIRDTAPAQKHAVNNGMPTAILEANCGITAIDEGIQALYTSGYMHNHMRMYVASIVTNVARAHWRMPAQWLYYHLFDADFASNIGSWQWVCAVRSSKLYFANQENINKYFKTSQRNTFLDVDYEVFDVMPIPDVLKPSTDSIDFEVQLPATQSLQIDTALPTYIYNFYNLDPLWDAAINANRILLLEPSHFLEFPVKPSTISFVLALAKNIPNIQVYTGEWDSLKELLQESEVRYKSHPLFAHYKGVATERDWLVPEIRTASGGFFNYWKKASTYLM
jgi:deoxyribodipyrimidine photo-lyase